MAYVDRYVLEEDLLTQVQEELERVRPKFENENLVICEPDYVFNNRFWTPHLDHCDPVDYNREVLLRSTLLLKNLAKFTNLKRLKVSEISFAQLRRLEQVAGLEVLEIDLLTVDTTFNFNVPLKFQQLQCMRIGEYKSNLLTSIPFRTPSLVAVSFGKFGPRLKCDHRKQIAPLILSPTNHLPSLFVLLHLRQQVPWPSITSDSKAHPRLLIASSRKADSPTAHWMNSSWRHSQI